MSEQGLLRVLACPEAELSKDRDENNLHKLSLLKVDSYLNLAEVVGQQRDAGVENLEG